MGYTVICPHANSALMDGRAERCFLAGDIEMLKRARHSDAAGMGVFGGSGARIHDRIDKGKKVMYWDEMEG